MAASSTVAATRHRPHRVAGIPRRRKVSVKLPAELVEDIEDRVGAGNVSRYIADTVADNERRVALREWLDELEAVHGPVTEDEIEEELTRWDADIRTDGSTEASSWTAKD